METNGYVFWPLSYTTLCPPASQFALFRSSCPQWPKQSDVYAVAVTGISICQPTSPSHCLLCLSFLLVLYRLCARVCVCARRLQQQPKRHRGGGKRKRAPRPATEKRRWKESCPNIHPLNLSVIKHIRLTRWRHLWLACDWTNVNCDACCSVCINNLLCRGHRATNPACEYCYSSLSGGYSCTGSLHTHCNSSSFCMFLVLAVCHSFFHNL